MATKLQKRGKKRTGLFWTLFFSVLSVVYLLPIVIVAINSFKTKTSISKEPFALPNEDTFAGFDHYVRGIEKTGFFNTVGYSLFITIGSVLVILLCTSMCAWFITRVQNKITKTIFYLCVFSMIVPFQMVMFTLSKTADMLKLTNPIGLIIVYLGFGAGLAVFMFSGFVKAIPIEIEEAAMIDGCNPIQTFFRIVLPILKPTCISVGILQTMWIWNDYLLPYLILDIKKYQTIPVAVQMALKGSYGAIDRGAMMAMLIVAIIPIIIFYLSLQKQIIKGVVAGAVKG